MCGTPQRSFLADAEVRMKITAHVQNSHNHHHITLATNDTAHAITIPPKSTSYDSSANGGELLFLALGQVSGVTAMIP